ncbi:tetratricopeptide repeat protein [Kribbella sp. NBC_01245]|uniref:tetratricopeptide repeat protein n=1 Tax=Kribbella sp. NBC_01245 TaxID=2903578 RepID=UPI002E2B1AC7|nr:tetratricopeptide repeat protein [Kribbella sp. NBC_01245]
MVERLERAAKAYERTVFGADASGLPAAAQELTALEADLALAQGQNLHAVYLDQRRLDLAVENPRELQLFERAAELYRSLDDGRGEGEATFWIGCFQQVVRDDHETAVPLFERSLELATEAGDALTRSYALRHLGFVAHASGRLDEARGMLEESTALRRELGFTAGVAANLIGLAYIAFAQERGQDCAALLDEADELAAEVGAKAVRDMVEEARLEM